MAKRSSVPKSRALTRYAGFLSFAEPDRTLVELIYRFLTEEVEVPVFFAPEDLLRGTEDWVNEIREGIKNSACFIPIFTRSSLSRPWVLYESGAADMRGLPFVSAKTAEISRRQSSLLTPGPNRYTYMLEQEREFTGFILKVYEEFLGLDRRNEDEGRITRLVEGSQLADEIKRRASRRSVFIAGSYRPEENSAMKVGLSSAPNLQGEQVLSQVTRELTRALLDAGFMISACPDVSAVGRSVATEVESWTRQKNYDWRDVFRVGGQLDIYDTTLQANVEGMAGLHDLLVRAFHDSRKEYLRSHEWLLVVGGHQRTEIECAAAEELGTVKICAIPSFDGTALSYWHKQAPERRSPISPDEKVWSADMTAKVVRFMKEN